MDQTTRDGAEMGWRRKEQHWWVVVEWMWWWRWDADGGRELLQHGPAINVVDWMLSVIGNRPPWVRKCAFGREKGLMLDALLCGGKRNERGYEQL